MSLSLEMSLALHHLSSITHTIIHQYCYPCVTQKASRSRNVLFKSHLVCSFLLLQLTQFFWLNFVVTVHSRVWISALQTYPHLKHISLSLKLTIDNGQLLQTSLAWPQKWYAKCKPMTYGIETPFFGRIKFMLPPYAMCYLSRFCKQESYLECILPTLWCTSK